jgi:hypothetical protein
LNAFKFTKANAQRHRYLNEQLSEAETLIQGLFQHKEKFKEILNTTTANYNNSVNKSSGSRATGSTSVSNNLKLNSYLTNAQGKQSPNNLLNKKKTRTSTLMKRNVRKKHDIITKNSILATNR